MTPDIPELLRPSDAEFYHQIPKPKEGWPDRDNPAALRKSLDLAHDNLKVLVAENDRLRAALLTLHRKLRFWIRVSVTALGILGSAMAGLLGWLIPYAVKGMAR